MPGVRLEGEGKGERGRGEEEEEEEEEGRRHYYCRKRSQAAWSATMSPYFSQNLSPSAAQRIRASLTCIHFGEGAPPPGWLSSAGPFDALPPPEATDAMSRLSRGLLEGSVVAAEWFEASYFGEPPSCCADTTFFCMYAPRVCGGRPASHPPLLSPPRNPALVPCSRLDPPLPSSPRPASVPAATPKTALVLPVNQTGWPDSPHGTSARPLR